MLVAPAVADAAREGVAPRSQLPRPKREPQRHRKRARNHRHRSNRLRRQRRMKVRAGEARLPHQRGRRPVVVAEVVDAVAVPSVVRQLRLEPIS